MFTISATEVRKEWSLVVDNVVRQRPQFIKRTRDYLMLTNLDMMEEVLSAYHFSAEQYKEDDGSITLSLNEIDLIENAPTLEAAKIALAKSILEYAEDFYKDFSYWGSAPNRKSHIPYVLKALILNDPEKIGEQISCHDGKN